MKQGPSLVAVLLVLILAGCGKGDDPSWTHQGHLVFTKTVVVDGVTCILMDGNYAGGISCDWSGR